MFVLLMAGVAGAGMGPVEAVTRSGDRLTLTSGPDVLEVEAAGEGVVRLHFQPGGVADAPTEVIKSQVWASVGAAIATNGDPIVIETSRMRVEIQRSPCRVTVYDAEGTFLIGEQAAEGIHGDGAFFDHRGDTDFYGIYGYGAFDGATDIRRNNGGFAEAGIQGDSGAPLIWSRHGFGVLADSDGVQFDVGSGTLDVYGISRTSVELFILVGTPVQIMEGVGRVSGTAPLFPKWSMGFHNTEWGIDQAELVSIVNTYRSKQIPIDHYILDFDWKAWSEDNYGEWRWNTAKFPDGPSGSLMTNMLAKGIKLSGIMKPRIHVNTVQGQYADDNNLWWPGQSPYSDYFSGQPVQDVDFRLAETRDWFFTNSLEAFRTGILGWWNDEADQAGGGGATFENMQFLNMQRSLYEGQRAITNQRVWSINRNFYLGAQRYAYSLWSGDIGGDFGAMAAQRSKMIASLNVGQAKWGMDIGGFNGEATPEGYARWMQFGAFVPVFRVHGQQFRQRQPWEYGPTAEEAAKQAIELRYRLIPYLYSHERLAAETGVGVARPLVWVYPDDASVAGSFEAWLFGDAFLVQPVMQPGASQVTVDLPAGSWFDYHDGSEHTGPTELTYPLSADWTNYPLFIKSGSIIPLQPVMNYVGEHPATNLTLKVFPDIEPASFTYYEDDGWTYAYETGSYFRQVITTVDAGGRVELGFDAPTGTYTPEVETWSARIYGPTSTSVHADGIALPEFADPASLTQQGGDGWTTTADRFGTVTLVQLAAGGAAQVVLSNNLVAPPAITPAGGAYPSPVLVAMTPGEPGSEVRYTLDGSEPDAGSLLYTAPFLVGQDTTVKAQAFLPGKTPSRVIQASYAFANNLINNPGFEDGGSTEDIARHWYPGEPDSFGGVTGNSIRENWGGYNSTWHGVVRGTWSGGNEGSMWQEVPAIPGATYTLSAQFWADSHWSADAQGMALTFVDGGGTVLGGATNLFGDSIGPVWEERALEAAAPAGTERVRVTFFAGPTYDGALRFDEVSLETDGERILSVVSAHGSPDPAVGPHTYPLGAVITNRVHGSIVTGNVAYVCTGWSMVGHDPSSGTGTSFVMTVTNSAILTWQWETNQLDPCTLGFADSSVSVGEADGAVTLTVLRGQSSNGLATVHYRTEAVSATAGLDFTPATGILQVAASATSAVITIAVTEDLVHEGAETFRVVLSEPSSNAELIAPTSVMVTITDNDPDLGTRTLTVESDHGAPDPAVGSQAYPYGTVIEASVGSPVTGGATQTVAAGWSGTGAVPASGVGNALSITLTNDSTLTWSWTTNVLLSAESAGDGTVLPAGDRWLPLGLSTQITAIAADGYAFSLWTGEVPPGQETNNPLVLTLDRARSVTAVFAQLPNANLLRNPGFEDGDTNDVTIARHWELGVPDLNGAAWGSAARVTWRPLSGGFHAAVRGGYAGEGNFGGYWQEVPATEGEVYTFSTWVYADSWFWADNRFMKIEFLDGADGGSNILAVTEQELPLNEVWQEVSITATAPVEATWVRVVLDVWDIFYGGAIQFEDLELRGLSGGPVAHPVVLTAGPGGTITPSGAVQVVDGGSLEVAVEAEPFHHIETISLPPFALFPSNPVRVTFSLTGITNLQTVSAVFAEDRTLGTPHAWLAGYHAGTDFTAMAATDLDGDGFTGAEEYIALTDPSSSGDYLRVGTAMNSFTGGVLRLTWSPRSNRVYDLERAPGMGLTFDPVATNLTGGSVEVEPDPGFPVEQFRLRVREAD